MSGHVRHLYVHLPFCAHRCGYCDFVTVVGRNGEHGRYVDALLRELELERGVLADERRDGLPRRRHADVPRPRRRSSVCFARCRAAAEVTVEANPETVTPELAALLRDCGVTRVSLGAQSFDPRLLEVLERRRTPDDVRRAFYALRDADFDNISLDLIYGIPGQSAADLERDLDEALALEPDHLSCYELEAKPGTRFTHTFGDELARQADAMEGYFERVVERADRRRVPLVRDRELLPARGAGGAADFRAQHNLAYWLGRDYLGARHRRRLDGRGRAAAEPCRASRATSTALESGAAPPRELERIDATTSSAGAGAARPAPRRAAAARRASRRRSTARRSRASSGSGSLASVDGPSLALTPRGRFLGGGVTAELLA